MPNYTPTFIRRDPITGQLTYSFDGRIGAFGFDLPIWNASNPGRRPGSTIPIQHDDARISWRKINANGAYVPDANDGSDTYIESNTLDGLVVNGSPALLLQSSSAAGANGVTVQAGVQSKTLLGSNGSSDFVLKGDTDTIRLSGLAASTFGPGVKITFGYLGLGVPALSSGQGADSNTWDTGFSTVFAAIVCPFVIPGVVSYVPQFSPPSGGLIRTAITCIGGSNGATTITPGVIAIGK